MFRLNNIKHNVLILSFTTLLAGCGGGGTATTTDSTSTDLTTTSTAKVVKIDISATTTEDSATINWTPYGYTTKSVEYGTSNKYGSTVTIQEEGTVTLSNLQANTEYHYRTVSEDERGRLIVSNDNTFTTLAAITQPIITDPAPTDPIVTDPTPTDPIITDPAPTDPIVTDPAPTDPIVTEPAPICQSGPAIQQGQIKDSTTGTGIADATITIAGCSTKTDANGYYTLTNIVTNDKANVTFNAEGYYKYSTIIQIEQYLEGTTDLSSNYTVIEMDKYISHWTYDSQTVVSGSHLIIPSGVYLNDDGNPYIGQVTAGLSYRTSAEKSTDLAFPGEYKGEDSNGMITPFLSYGFMVIDITDENGSTLNLSENITLIFEATGATDNIIPLWYYDYLKGLWIEEGYAELQADGTYKGDISHQGTWSLNKPLQDLPGIYRGRIIFQDETSAKNVRVHAVGSNWISSNLSTDETGLFEIEVIPGEAFQLKAYNYKDKYESIYNGTIAAVPSGEVVEDRI